MFSCGRGLHHELIKLQRPWEEHHTCLEFDETCMSLSRVSISYTLSRKRKSTFQIQYSKLFFSLIVSDTHLYIAINSVEGIPCGGVASKVRILRSCSETSSGRRVRTTGYLTCWMISTYNIRTTECFDSSFTVFRIENLVMMMMIQG